MRASLMSAPPHVCRAVRGSRGGSRTVWRRAEASISRARVAASSFAASASYLFRALSLLIVLAAVVPVYASDTASAPTQPNVRTDLGYRSINLSRDAAVRKRLVLWEVAAGGWVGPAYRGETWGGAVLTGGVELHRGPGIAAGVGFASGAPGVSERLLWAVDTFWRVNRTRVVHPTFLTTMLANRDVLDVRPGVQLEVNLTTRDHAVFRLGMGVAYSLRRDGSSVDGSAVATMRVSLGFATSKAQSWEGFEPAEPTP